MLVMDVFTRRIVGFGVESAGIDGVSVCRMFSRASAAQSLPKHVSTDHDPLFRFHRWLANLRVLEIEEIKSVPYTPVSHPFVERLVGTIRREHLDKVFFWNAVDLARKLGEFRDLVGQKAPLKVKDIWAIRVRLQMQCRVRDLALFNLGIDSKLRACDLVKLRVRDVSQGDRVASRAIVLQQKTRRPVQFEITTATAKR
jgi:hypothetical protein